MLKKVVIRGRAYWRLTDSKGRIVDTIAARGKLKSKQSATRLVKRNNSLHIGLKRTVHKPNLLGQRLVEVKDTRSIEKIKVPKKATRSIAAKEGKNIPTGEFQGYAEIITEQGKFRAVSKKSRNKKAAIKQAILNVSRRAADYDEDQAEDIYEQARTGKIPLNAGIIYYRLF